MVQLALRHTSAREALGVGESARSGEVFACEPALVGCGFAVTRCRFILDVEAWLPGIDALAAGRDLVREHRVTALEPLGAEGTMGCRRGALVVLGALLVSLGGLHVLRPALRLRLGLTAATRETCAQENLHAHASWWCMREASHRR
jgi:hypothetical protein